LGLRLQLATTQAYSQLNLGHLIHQADNYRGSFRGEGFEQPDIKSSACKVHPASKQGDSGAFCTGNHGVESSQ